MESIEKELNEKTEIVEDDDSFSEEIHGPRARLSLTIDQATLILRRHLKDQIEEVSCSNLSLVKRGFNNQTYIVTSTSLDPSFKIVIIRISGKNWTRWKTENEVATITYLSNVLPKTLPIPKILGFCSNRELSYVGNEYILMEKLTGEPLDDHFAHLDLSSQKRVLDQLVTIIGEFKSQHFNKIGSFRFIPEIGDTFGLNIELKQIDPLKDIEIGVGLEANAGPFESYLEYLQATGRTELEYLKTVPFMLEGEGIQLYERIKALLDIICDPKETLLTPITLSVPFVFTHGDFEPRNVLFNPVTLEVTGILDFEFSGSFPIDEDWFAGFSWIGAGTSEWSLFNEDPVVDDDHPHPNKVSQLRQYFLEELSKKNVPVPDEIKGHEERALMYFFKSNICPWFLREKIEPVPQDWYKKREDARRRIQFVLNKYGF